METWRRKREPPRDVAEFDEGMRKFRPWRIGRRRALLVAAVVLVVAGAVAAVTLYRSNQKAGTWTTGEGLTISGYAVPTVIDFGTQTDVSGTVTNGLNRTMSGIVVRLNVTSAGLTAEDLSIAMAWNSVAWVAITGTSCGVDCLTYASAPFDLAALSSVTLDVRITPNSPGTYTWTVVAVGSA